MVKKNYQEKIESPKTARAFASNQGISLKFATEMCREIRNKKIEKAEAMIQRILEKKDFLPLRVYRKKTAHRRGESKSGVKSGRYPEKVCNAFLNILNSVKANADFKGLDAENLLIVHAFASQGFRRGSHQPKGKIAGKRWAKKSTHIEVVVREAA